MIYDSHACTLGEGAFWHPARGEFFWCDILERQVRSKAQIWQLDEYVSAMGWLDETRVLLASQTALSVFDISSGTRERVVALEASNPLTRSNDGRADPYGGFWIGTMGIKLEHEAGAIYRFYRGELRQLYQGITIPNAISFTPDGGHAYFADTALAKVWRVALDSHGWPKGVPEVFLHLKAQGLNPDGAVVDAQGHFWSAQWGAARVAEYAPDGQFLSAVSFPGKQTSCPSFGGLDLTQLFVTTAAEGLSGPNEGLVYVEQTATRGQAEHRVIL